MHSAVAQSSRTSTAQLGRASHTRTHARTQPLLPGSLGQTFWAASLRLIKTTVHVCVCVYASIKYAPPGTV